MYKMKKFNELSSNVNEQNTKIDSKFNELKSDINHMKQQKVNINKRLKEIDEHGSTCLLYTSRCV